MYCSYVVISVLHIQVDAATLLPLLMPAILDGLQDQYDDVRAIAAAALLPVARKLPSLLPEKVRALPTIFAL